MQKAMIEGVVLELSDDQKREKAAALMAHLTRILDPGKVRVIVPFRAAEARVVGIDISVTKEELREILAKEGGCKTEDVQLGEVRSARNELGSAWMRAVSKLAQAGRIPIGWGCPTDVWRSDTRRGRAPPKRTGGTYATGAAARVIKP